ncbi:MAG TPA: type II toxin-antitoxin system VapC family toxin, partial [Candidatus Tumulicola sp.]|nr:type II toxin-antitoxin system VapC family toxin [Candidatus Tumulicola sp.]
VLRRVMRILLDTHVLIWLASRPDRLSKDARAALASPDNEIMFSAASIWELAIKSQLGRVSFDMPLDEIATAMSVNGFAELPVRSSAASRVARLPLYHRDPFDRLLVAQSLDEAAYLFTADAKLVQYSENVRLL